MQGITVFSYANSMFNPILYAFFNENFRSRFLKAFGCFRYKQPVRSACRIDGIGANRDEAGRALALPIKILVRHPML